MNRLRQALVIVCLLLLAALIFTPALQIVMRGVFNVPLSGAEELARYFLVGLTLLGAAHVTHGGGQIRMEEIQALMPDSLRYAMQLLIETLAVALFGLMAVASAISIANNLDNQTATLEMPYWLFMAPLTVGMALLTMEHGLALVQAVRRGRAADKHTTLA